MQELVPLTGGVLVRVAVRLGAVTPPPGKPRLHRWVLGLFAVVLTVVGLACGVAPALAAGAADDVGRVHGRSVSAAFVNHDSDLFEVEVVGQGGSSTLETTAGHPFWDVSRGGWVRADQLGVGDVLASADGRRVRVGGVQATPGAADRWDLSVEVDHDFFVLAGSVPVLVHNCPINPGNATNSGDEFVNLASQARTTHILQGDATGGGHLWPGGVGKSPFPESWSGDRVMHEISDIATDPVAWADGTNQGTRAVLNGTRGGVDLRVVVDRGTGEIITGHPTNLPRNP